MLAMSFLIGIADGQCRDLTAAPVFGDLFPSPLVSYGMVCKLEMINVHLLYLRFSPIPPAPSPAPTTPPITTQISSAPGRSAAPPAPPSRCASLTLRLRTPPSWPLSPASTGSSTTTTSSSPPGATSRRTSPPRTTSSGSAGSWRETSPRDGASTTRSTWPQPR